MKRELGAGPRSIRKPDGMNGSPDLPYFEAEIGELRASASADLMTKGELLELRVSFNDGLGSLLRYFYADDLTECWSRMELAAAQSRLDYIEENAFDGGELEGLLRSKIAMLTAEVKRDVAAHSAKRSRKKSNMSGAEIERRFAEINAREPETLTPEEETQLAEAERMDDGTTVSLDRYKLSH